MKSRPKNRTGPLRAGPERERKRKKLKRKNIKKVIQEMTRGHRLKRDTGQITVLDLAPGTKRKSVDILGLRLGTLLDLVTARHGADVDPRTPLHPPNGEDRAPKIEKEKTFDLRTLTPVGGGDHGVLRGQGRGDIQEIQDHPDRPEETGINRATPVRRTFRRAR